ncbi:MAG: TIGR02281 family clan AA aspartic protease [Gammaproteobacteria bacterium]|jgi:aspartyl protease family protein
MTSTHRTGTVMYVIAIAGFIALMAWLFSGQIAERRNPNRDVTRTGHADGTAGVVLARNRAGHYVATGRINGVEAEFMIDTGATDVAVSEDVARAAGLARGPAQQVTTANGLAMAYLTRIDTLELGGIVEQDVRASIVPAMAGIDVLLGMSFLQRLDFEQRGDELRLEQRTGRRPL